MTLKAKAAAKAPKTAKITLTPIAKLTKAKYNPTDRSLNDIGTLATSIEEYGLLSPILITSKGEVVEGHRRLAAVAKLEWTHIPAVIVHGDPAKMYREINTHTKKHSGNQTLRVYLQEPEAVGHKARAKFVEAEKFLGKPLVRRLANEGFSISTWDLAKRVLKASDTDHEPGGLGKTVVLWMMKYRCQGIVKEVLGRGTNVSQVLVAAKKNKQIKATYSA